VSFREITMQDVPEVLRRSQAGQSARHIARETDLDRKRWGATWRRHAPQAGTRMR
jgi:hypothetical protein